MLQDKYSVNDIAKMLEFSYSTVLNLIKTNKIKGQMYGGRWFVSKEELVRFKEEGNHPDSLKGDDIDEDNSN